MIRALVKCQAWARKDGTVDVRVRSYLGKAANGRIAKRIREVVVEELAIERREAGIQSIQLPFHATPRPWFRRILARLGFGEGKAAEAKLKPYREGKVIR